MVCSSRFSISGDNFCLGAPLECMVTLDPTQCVEGRDNFTTDALEVSLFDTGPSANFEPTFNFMQTDSLLSIVLNYIPEVTMSTINIEVGARVNSCRFLVTASSTVQRSTDRCLYPLLFQLRHSSPVHPAVVKGGEMVEIGLSMTNTGSLLVEQLFFCLESVHPALALVTYTFAFGDDRIVKTRTNPSVSDSCILEDEVICLDETLFANLTFRVQSFVLPQAKLYSSFGLLYHLKEYGAVTFEQGLKLFEGYTADEVTQGNWTFSLPFYADKDHVDFTFPPHVDDIFSIDVPITVPCVSTDINVSITIPEFRSDNFTMFFVHVTEVRFTLPPNMERVTNLCLYQDTGFGPSECEPSNMTIETSPPVITRSEMEGPGVDFLIYLGPVLYFLRPTEECLLDASYSYCTCLEEDIIITFTGHVADDSEVCDNRMAYPLFEDSSCGIFCENQTLADNMTSHYNYTFEVTIERDPLRLDFNPAITRDIGERDELFPVNASMPAICVPINSFCGDAGDSYNLTFGVLHNSEYSSFTAYNLNYTFSVDPHLRHDDSITICFFNGSSEPVHCEDTPLINRTISRFGDHPV